MAKKLKWLLVLFLPLFSLTLTSCSDDDDNASVSIVGVWVSGSETLTLGKDGSYREDGTLNQYRIGTYSYNASSGLLVVNVQAIAGNNSAYKRTYIVQTLTSSSLVLLETDGDVKGYYTKK